jgi:cytoskeletal protein RodZ
MVESVGKKLNQARLKHGLTVDEAAHATKLRPDKIVALENDDYSLFANNTYAKGFLQIYGRFLKVDVSEFARTLDNANPISISDYQYLSNAPAPRQDNSHICHSDERRAPSLAPLFGFILLVGLGLGGSWVWTTYERIQNEEQARIASATASQIAPPTPNPDAAFINDTPPRAVAVTPRPSMSTPLPVAVPTPAGRVAAATPLAITPAPLNAVTPAPPLAGDLDFVQPAPVAMGDPSARPALPAGVNEVLVATVKKTWVTVRKDDPKAPPIFEDYVYPNANPLKLKGARFFIEAKDPASVQITKNGLPVAYPSAAVPVQ